MFQVLPQFSGVREELTRESYQQGQRIRLITEWAHELASVLRTFIQASHIAGAWVSDGRTECDLFWKNKQYGLSRTNLNNLKGTPHMTLNLSTLWNISTL